MKVVCFLILLLLGNCIAVSWDDGDDYEYTEDPYERSEVSEAPQEEEQRNTTETMQQETKATSDSEKESVKTSDDTRKEADKNLLENSREDVHKDSESTMQLKDSESEAPVWPQGSQSHSDSQLEPQNPSESRSESPKNTDSQNEQQKHSDSQPEPQNQSEAQQESPQNKVAQLESQIEAQIESQKSSGSQPESEHSESQIESQKNTETPKQGSGRMSLGQENQRKVSTLPQEKPQKNSAAPKQDAQKVFRGPLSEQKKLSTALQQRPRKEPAQNPSPQSKERFQQGSDNTTASTNTTSSGGASASPKWMATLEDAIHANSEVLEDTIVARLRKDLKASLNGTKNVSAWMPAIETAIRENNDVLEGVIVRNLRKQLVASVEDFVVIKAIEDAIKKNNNYLGEAIVNRLRQDLNGIGVCERRSPSNPPPMSVSHGELIKQLKKDFAEVMEKLYRNLDEAKVKVTAQLGRKYDKQSDQYIGYIAHLTKNVKLISEGIRKSKLAFLERLEEAEESPTKEERGDILDKIEALVRGKKKSRTNDRSTMGEDSTRYQKTDSPPPQVTDTADKASDLLGAATESFDDLTKIIDPSVSWQERTESGLNTAAAFVGLLPNPVGDIGSVVLGLVAAFFGASSPTTDEYKQLRNQLLDGMKNLFDETQKMEAIGCIHKIEFLKGLLEVNDRSVMTDKEFYAIILAGAIDVGVSTLATFKYKMEVYRDKNTVQSGRDALDMAHFYVKVAQARDMLHSQIINFIGISGTKAGITERFFKGTQLLGQRDYQHLFFWEDKCCEKNEKHFSALLAYNLPMGKHSGKGKAVDELSTFIKKYRTDAYYKYHDVGADVVLSYDGATGVGPHKEYVVGERTADVDDRYYRYQQFNWKSFYLGVPALAYRVPVGNDYLMCDREKSRYIMKLGVSKTTASMRFNANPDAGDPLVGTIPSFMYEGAEYFLGSTTVFRDKFKKFMREFGLTATLSATSVDAYLTRNIISCISSKPKIKNRQFSGTVNWKDYIENGKIRFFKVNFSHSKWTEPLYIVSPVVAKPKDDGRSYVITADSSKGGYMDIPMPASDTEKDRALTPDVLIDDTVWKNVWFKQQPGNEKEPEVKIPSIGDPDKNDDKNGSSKEDKKEDKNEKENKKEMKIDDKKDDKKEDKKDDKLSTLNILTRRTA